MGTILSIASHKGGVGKTAVTLNLGVSLANAGHRVLLIDGDTQASLATSVDVKKKSKAGLYQVINGSAHRDEVVVAAKKIPLSMAHLGIEAPGDVFSLSHGLKRRKLGALRKLIQHFAQDYDFTLIDTANNVGSLNATLLSCSDFVIIPITCKMNAIRSLPLLLKLLDRIKNKLNPDLAVLGLVLSRLDVNNPYELEVLSTVREAFPRGTFFSTLIPLTTLYEKADVKALPVCLLPEAENMQQAYEALSREVLLRLKNSQKGFEHDDLPEALF